MDEGVATRFAQSVDQVESADIIYQMNLFGRVLPFIPPVGRKIKNGPGTMFLNSGDQVRLLGDVAGYTITERSVQKAPTGLH